jgi:hypothetical protein
MPIEAQKVRIFKLQDQDKHDDTRSTTPAQRLEMMWQLALDAWAVKGERIPEQSLQRNVVWVIRLEGK